MLHAATTKHDSEYVARMLINAFLLGPERGDSSRFTKMDNK